MAPLSCNIAIIKTICACWVTEIKLNVLTSHCQRWTGKTVPLRGHGENCKYCQSNSLIREKPVLFLENKEQSSLSKHCILDQSQALRAQSLKEEEEEEWFCAIHFYLCSSEKGVDLRFSWSEGHGLCPSKGNAEMFCPSCYSLEL